MPNALPVRRWHARQWQMETSKGSPCAVRRSCPQLQAASRVAIAPHLTNRRWPTATRRRGGVPFLDDYRVEIIERGLLDRTPDQSIVGDEVDGSGNALVGAWRLVSCETRADDGSIDYPLGRDADGLLIYTDDGHMSVSLARSGRQPFAAGDILGGTGDEKARAVESYISYLRRKIDPHSSEALIQTKRGFGYMLKAGKTA